MSKLYHYTSVEGFEGIINNNTIRMTKSDFLNDPSDCRLFITLIDKYLEANPNVLTGAISNLQNYRVEVEELCRNRECGLVDYIKYIRKHIGLYVMSFTNTNDGMNMWNYYGRGGIELEFDMTELIDSIRGEFVSEKEFLTQAKVIYANSELDIRKIIVPDFSNFELINNKSRNLFNEHRQYLNRNSDKVADQLYSTSRLDKFVDTYVNSYVNSLEYLLNNSLIYSDTPSDIIFDEVFKNVSKLNNKLFWKHDLSLYMLVLSALIKADTYEYENEHRIVYFEYNIDMNKQKAEKYSVKEIYSGNFICPYITFTDEELLRNSLCRILISPVTSNLPISEDSYKETLRKFLVSKGLSNSINVDFSKHIIRW